jgi:CheY-like chemotaxis protein
VSIDSNVEAFNVTDIIFRCGPRKLAKSLTLCLEAYKNSKEPGKPLPSMTEVLNSGQDKDLQDGPFRRVMESANNALADEAAAKGHTGDAPLQHPHEDTLEMAQGKTKVPKLDTTHLEGNANLASPAPLESTSPFSKSSSDSEKLVRKVLLVDDNKINLQLLVTYIRKSGHAFMTANNGLEALEAYKSQCEEGKDGEMADSPFDYVLMDLSVCLIFPPSKSLYFDA